MRVGSCLTSKRRPVTSASIAFAAVFLLSAFGVGSAADVPYYSYTFNYWRQAVPAPQAYVPARLIDSSTLGVELGDPKDLFSIGDRTYILDSGGNKIVCVDADFRVRDVIASFHRAGRTETFNKPEGIFVTPDGHIYVADTGNSRVVVLDDAGRFIKEITRPEADVEGIVTENFAFYPRKVAVDQVGRAYVLAREVYDGIMVFQNDGRFTGFIGAPRVTPSAADIFWRAIATREQRERSGLLLPTAYENLDIDTRGFIYGCIRTSTVSGASPYIKRLSPSGEDVIRALGFTRPIGDPGRAWGVTVRFVDILVRQGGTYSVLDQALGRIFTYDDNGNLLYVFGGLGTQRGLFKVPVALSAIGDRILVLDSLLKRVTVFEPTEYARLIHLAMALYRAGRYSESAAVWGQVLAVNPNYDLAYTGIGRSLLMQGRAREAMDYFGLGQDRRNYSRAWADYRRDIVYQRLPMVMTVLVVAVAALYLASRAGLMARLAAKLRSSRRQSHRAAVTGIRGRIAGWWRDVTSDLAYAAHVSIHPFEGFWSLKYEKRGSMPAAIVILSLTIAVYLMACQYTGFIFNGRNLNDLNVYTEVLTILVPFFLWTGVNWALTTLMDGKGTAKDIFIATAYALVPLVVLNIQLVLMSNLLVEQEGSLYTLFSGLAFVWTGFLVFSGTMVTHEYSVGKTIFAIVLIVAGMVLCLFLGLLFFVLIDQVIAFLDDLLKELSFRI